MACIHTSDDDEEKKRRNIPDIDKKRDGSAPWGCLILKEG